MPSLDATLTIPFGKYKDQPIEVVAADTSYREWLTGQQWFKSKYRDLYRALRDGAEPKPVTAEIGHTEPARPILETAETWPPWEPPPVPGCLAESGLPLTGLVWCPVHRDYEELIEGAPAVRLTGGRFWSSGPSLVELDAYGDFAPERRPVTPGQQNEPRE